MARSKKLNPNFVYSSMLAFGWSVANLMAAISHCDCVVGIEGSAHAVDTTTHTLRLANAKRVDTKRVIINLCHPLPHKDHHPSTPQTSHRPPQSPLGYPASIARLALR